MNKYIGVNVLFLSLGFELKGHKVLFQDKNIKDCSRHLQFTGIPFIILGSTVMECAHGKDRNITHKRKRLENKLRKVQHLYIPNLYNKRSQNLAFSLWAVLLVLSIF